MVRLIFYNIEYLEGLQGKKIDYLKVWRRVEHPKGIEKRLAAALKKYNPDIVSFAEIGGSSFLEKDYFSYIGRKLGMKHRTKHLKYKLDGSMRLLKKVPVLNQQTNGILSKNKISNVRTLYLKEGAKKAVIKAKIGGVNLLLVHLALGKGTRKKQIDELVEIVREINGPVILAGDFNTFKGEEEIKPLIKKAALKHKFRLHGGRVFTYPTYHPRKRFDYILTSKDVKVKEYSVLDMPFSDHLPVMVDFEVKN